MMYQFARYQLSPDLQGWYLVLKPNDIDTLMELHKGVAHLYFSKFALDPPPAVAKLPGLYRPIEMAASWLQTVSKQLLDGVSLVVNSKGGWLPLADVKVLSTIESETMSWPNIYEDEVITISRWPKGLHFYLSSNKDRIFSPGKYHKYEDALRVAKKYTEDIRTKDSL